MTAQIAKVGIREFRAHLQQYLFTSTPMAITRHGETIGYYIPTKQHPNKTELTSLKQAAAQLDKILADKGLTEDELLADFRALREGKDD